MSALTKNSCIGLLCLLWTGSLWPAKPLAPADLLTGPAQQSTSAGRATQNTVRQVQGSGTAANSGSTQTDADPLRLRLEMALQRLGMPSQERDLDAEAAAWPDAPPVDEDGVAPTRTNTLSATSALVRSTANIMDLPSDGKPSRPLSAAPSTVPALPTTLAATMQALLSQTASKNSSMGVTEVAPVAATSCADRACRPTATLRPKALLPPRNALGGTRLALSEQTLGAIRGGFTGINGLQVSFGIERTVYINGNLVSTTSLNVSPQGQVTGTGESLALIQSGVGNSFAPQIILPSSSMAATVIQNTLNDQKIQALTVINATVHSMQMLRSLDFQASMRDAIAGSLRK